MGDDIVLLFVILVFFFLWMRGRIVYPPKSTNLENAIYYLQQDLKKFPDDANVSNAEDFVKEIIHERKCEKSAEAHQLSESILLEAWRGGIAATEDSGICFDEWIKGVDVSQLSEEAVVEILFKVYEMGAGMKDCNLSEFAKEIVNLSVDKTDKK